MLKSSLADLNVLAISMVEDHPGYPYVAPVVESGLMGNFRLLLHSSMPLRARWLMTTRWKIPKAEADAAIRDFLNHPRAHYVNADAKTLRRAFELSDELHHDVYDTFLIALAQEHGAETILSTDANLEGPCKKAGLGYENPVPKQILRRFVDVNR